MVVIDEPVDAEAGQKAVLVDDRLNRPSVPLQRRVGRLLVGLVTTTQNHLPHGIKGVVVHQVGTVVLELRVVAVRRQRFIDKHKARIRAIRDTALSTRFAAAACRSAIAGVHHVRHQQVARAQQVIAHLINVKAIGGAFGFSLA